MFQPNVIYVQNPEPVIIEVKQDVKETVEQHTRRVARETGVEEDALWNLVLAESSGGERLEGDNGDSCGLVHINKNFFPEEFENCYDNDFSLRFAADLLLKGKEHLFTSCNCYQYAKYVSGYKLPKMADIKPNTYAFEGAVAKFEYEGVNHLAVVEELHHDYFVVREANYEKCKTGKRTITWDDPALKGFWKPTSTSTQPLAYDHQ